MKEFNPDFKELDLFDQEKVLEEEIEAFYAMCQTDGWLYVCRWVDRQKESLNRRIHTCELDEVDKLRGEARAFQRLLDFVSHTLELRK